MKVGTSGKGNLGSSVKLIVVGGVNLGGIGRENSSSKVGSVVDVVGVVVDVEVVEDAEDVSDFFFDHK
jgi:hypothetical protein